MDLLCILVSHIYHLATISVVSFNSIPFVAIEMARSESDALLLVSELLKERPITQDADCFVSFFDPDAVDRNRRTSLHLACIEGYREVVGLILQYAYHRGGVDGKQVDINLQDSVDDLTPLMCAIQEKHDKVVEELFSRKNLDYHVSVNKRDRKRPRRHDLSLRTSRSGLTTLHLTSEQEVEMENVALLLCKNKAQVNLHDLGGYVAACSLK